MVRVFGSNELTEDVFQHDLCIGCGACVNLCPYYRNYQGKTARLFPCDLSEGRCHAYCPKAELDLDALTISVWNQSYDGSPLGTYRQILAAKAGKDAPKGLFQAGGSVTSLITFMLKNNFIDAAVLTDREGLTPVPRLVTDCREVSQCASSKFMAAPTLSALNEGTNDGYTRMGVVATPCQMMAVAQMRANPLGIEDFVDSVAFSVGLFCNWSLDTRQLSALLSEKIDVAGIRGMDIPPPPAGILAVETTTGRAEIPLSEIKSLIPHTCFICLDLTSEFSDVSVGMFEGRPGWNTMIVRSEKGLDYIEKAAKENYLDVENMPQGNIAHLCQAATEKKQRALRTLIRRGLINSKNEDKRCAVRLPAEIVNKILG